MGHKIEFKYLDKILYEQFQYYCSAQTRTGIGLLGKPPAVKQFPPTKANRRTPLLRDPRGNAGTKRTSVVEHNLYFARARDRGINKRSKPKGLRQN
jgi:hypothetical protein